MARLLRSMSFSIPNLHSRRLAPARLRFRLIGTFAEDAFDAFDDGPRRYILHAVVVMRAAAQFPQIARRALQLGAQHRAVAPIRSGPDRVGRAENADDGAAERHRKMHR